jgi:hypothetical protein
MDKWTGRKVHRKNSAGAERWNLPKFLELEFLSYIKFDQVLRSLQNVFDQERRRKLSRFAENAPRGTIRGTGNPYREIRRGCVGRPEALPKRP